MRLPVLTSLFILTTPLAGGQTSSFCAPTPNSTGAAAVIATTGSLDVSQNSFGLACSGLPTDALGVFLVSGQSAAASTPPGSSGNLCLGPSPGVFSGSILDSGSSGAVGMGVDLTSLPLAGGTAVGPGDTFFFQYWFRDRTTAGTTNNFSDGVEVTFDPPPVSFATDIYAGIFTTQCFGCHGNSGQLALNGGAASAYANLVLQSSQGNGAACAPLRVDPGNAGGSLLVQVLERTCSSVGTNMGPTGGQAQIDVIRAWIDAGAPNN